MHLLLWKRPPKMATLMLRMHPLLLLVRSWIHQCFNRVMSFLLVWNRLCRWSAAMWLAEIVRRYRPSIHDVWWGECAAGEITSSLFCFWTWTFSVHWFAGQGWDFRRSHQDWDRYSYAGVSTGDAMQISLVFHYFRIYGIYESSGLVEGFLRGLSNGMASWMLQVENRWLIVRSTFEWNVLV